MSSAAQRQASFKRRMQQAGLVQCNVWVPAGSVPELQRAAELMREAPELTIARLVDRNTGRLRSLKPVAKSS